MHKAIASHTTSFILAVVSVFSVAFVFPASAGEPPLVFPLPQEMEENGNHFRLDEKVLILLPGKPSDNDLFVARFLASELAERHGMVLQAQNAPKLHAGRVCATIDRERSACSRRPA